MTRQLVLDVDIQDANWIKRARRRRRGDRPKPIVEHLKGKHNQQLHAKGGGSDPTVGDKFGELPDTNTARKAWDALGGDRFDRTAQQEANPDNYFPRRGFGVALKVGAQEWRTTGGTRSKPLEGLPEVYQVEGKPWDKMSLEERINPITEMGSTAPDGSRVGVVEVPGSRQTTPYAYRVMAVDEWDVAQARGYFKSDERSNLITGPGGEGTVASDRSTGAFYAPTDGRDFKVVRFDLKKEDGWREDPADNYLKTDKKIPVSSLSAWSEPIKGGRPGEVSITEHLKGKHNQQSHGKGGGSEGAALDTMITELQTSGGFTKTVKTGRSPKTGYVVAIPGHSGVFPADTFVGPNANRAEARKMLRSWINANKATLDKSKYLGGWNDTSFKKVVFDVVEVKRSKAATVRAGRERGEAEVWDVVKKEGIPTGGTGGYRDQP